MAHGKSYKRRNWSAPGYCGRLSAFDISGGTNRPPRKCTPLKCWAHTRRWDIHMISYKMSKSYGFGAKYNITLWYILLSMVCIVYIEQYRMEVWQATKRFTCTPLPHFGAVREIKAPGIKESSLGPERHDQLQQIIEHFILRIAS